MKKTIQFVFHIIGGLLLLFSILPAAHSSAATHAIQTPIWQDVQERDLPPGVEQLVVPQRFRLLALDLPQMSNILSGAPLERVGDPNSWASAVNIRLPLPTGKFGSFRVVESPVMAPELAARYPQIKTYLGSGVEDPTTRVRLDITPLGFHAMLFTPEGVVYIDPYQRGNTHFYASYFKKDYAAVKGDWAEAGPFFDSGYEQMQLLPQLSLASGEQLRTYRLAVAATGEYTQYFGGTVADGLAAVVVAVNRVTGVYEREVAVRLVLVADNDKIIYTDGAADPYTNNDGVAMLSENQTNLDLVIGSANYDVGHVFSTGGGGVAYVGVPCRSNWKARGVTGLPNPVGDPFYIDYVAHEMGHQFGANHTFNSTLVACGGGNRNASTAYEPGSGTTIMGYAGICGVDNTQMYSDDTFHTISWQEIIAYTTGGQGNNCPVITNTNNHAPVVSAGTGGFSIPINTPFKLVGEGYDPDGDPITYSWEEFDLGPAGSPDTPSGTAPIFRSFLPSSTERTFPRMFDIVNNTHTIGELLPSYSRGLTFRLTARDNHANPSAGGVAYSTIAFSASSAAGPFLVTQPNTALTWNVLSPAQVTWDVANTNLDPVNCSAVNISLSIDGGYTYPVSILENTPNDGSEKITVPDYTTAQARVKVACSNNIFFDISNENFTIDPPVDAAYLDIHLESVPVDRLTPGSWITYTVSVTNTGSITATASITDALPAGLINTACEDVPGSLDVIQFVLPRESVHFTCVGQVDPLLDLSLQFGTASPAVYTGDLVTYTLTVINPSTVFTLTNITVDGTNLTDCVPELTESFMLSPQQEKEFICQAVISAATTSLVSASAEVSFSNTAYVSAPEDLRSVLSSPTVYTIVSLQEQSEVSVRLLPRYVFLPLMQR